MGIKNVTGTALEDLFDSAGKQHNLDPDWLRAIAHIETGNSNYDKNGRIVTSPTGVQGRMQITNETARGLGITDRLNDEQTIPGAARYLSDALDKNQGNTLAALRAYNSTDPQYAAKAIAAYNAIKAQKRSAPNSSVQAPSSAAHADLESELLGAGAPQAASPDHSALEAELTGGGAAEPPKLDHSKFGPTLQDARDMMGKQIDTVRAADSARPWADRIKDYLTVDPNMGERIKDALAPTPGQAYGTVLPVAFTPDANGDAIPGTERPAMPSLVRDTLQGLYSASQAPATGTLTPEATMALAGMGMGGSLGKTVARDTGAAIGSRLFGAGRNEANDLLGPQFRAAPQLQAPTPALGLDLAAQAEPVLTSSPVPGLPAPATRLQFPSMQPAAGAADTAAEAVAQDGLARLTGAPAVQPPPRPLTPVLTQSHAEAHVNRLLDHFGQGGNTTPSAPPIPGNPITLAQATGNAGYAALENGLRGTDPHFNNLYRAQADLRAQNRGQAFQQLAGTSNDIETARAARDAATSAARDAAFADTKPTDPQIVLDQAHEVLAGPDGKRPAVVRAITPILDALQKADGSGLETDPQMLYGIRKAINDTLEAKGTSEASDAQRANSQLVAIKQTLDKVIESGAPGFRAYINQFSEMSRPIDAMRWLQSQNITDQQGAIQLGKLDSTVKRLQAQRGKPGTGAADSVTPEQIDALTALRDDLRRESAVNKTLPVGSPTVQNLATNHAVTAFTGGIDGLTALSAITAHPATIPLVAARYWLNKLSSRGEALVQQELRNRLLNPQISGAPGQQP